MLFTTLELGDTVIVDPPQFKIPPPSTDAIFDTIALAFLTVIKESDAAIPPPCPPSSSGAPMVVLPLIVHELKVAVSLYVYTPPPIAMELWETLEFILMLVALITAGVLSLVSTIPPPVQSWYDMTLFAKTSLLVMVTPALTIDTIPPPEAWAPARDVAELYATLLSEILSVPWSTTIPPP